MKHTPLIALIASACLLPSLALADGSIISETQLQQLEATQSQYTPVQNVKKVVHHNIYIEVAGGYNFSALGNHNNIPSQISKANDFKQSGNTYAGSLQVGYRWNPYFSLEAGGLYIMPITGKNTFSGYKLSQWALDSALCATFNIVDGIDAFLKIGALYHHMTLSYPTITGVPIVKNTSFYQLAPFGAAGIRYHINRALYLAAQYTVIPATTLALKGKYSVNGSSETVTVKPNIPLQQVIMLTVGFNV